jgi:hypothetical protein
MGDEDGQHKITALSEYATASSALF